jgi:outer membrane protein assembly factor BamB
MDVNDVSDLWNIVGQSFDTSFVLLLQQYSEWNYSAWGLDPVTLELHWHVPLTQLNNPQSMTWLSDSENFYGLDYQGGQILAYTSSNGSTIWRAGLPTPPNDGGELEQYTFAWDDGNPTALWIFNGSELASIVPR